MEQRPATNLQVLILRRLMEMGTPGSPMLLREAAERSGGVLSYARLRAMARGERGDILTVREAAALAAALDVPVLEVEMAATVLPDL